jgi:integrase
MEFFMSRLYLHRDKWYLDISVNNKRIRKSLHTTHKSTAKKVAKGVEDQIIRSVLHGKKPVWSNNMPLHILIEQFINTNHGWSIYTCNIYKDKLYYYLRYGLPENPTTRSMVIRCVNRMNRWAYDNNLIPKLKKLEGGSRWEHRMRTFNNEEMKLILNDVKPYHFQLFVRFAYYTGCRRGEICSLTEENIREEFVAGKSGKRRIKLNKQAVSVLDEIDSLWEYRPAYITQTFKKNLRRLGIKNGRLHDLRRTFGYNLIKQGMPIYQLSKLLGHSSVTTTEKHYAPLLATDVGEFIL